ncbi:hypothetical protein CVT24_004818 [Panaeolus cyanescens]|uniref:DUF6534 domain-containing protein n=1 Tax=Panaeolus cyanescens TaxID=181874 RepID=A0A409VQ21_9AGAR|nr:hypothetical protein CVT24_004818 [Panaeolus cyanescens]
MAEPMLIPTVSELEQTFGVILIGYVVAMVAFGFTLFQTYVYFSKYSLDSVWSKTVIGFLCLAYVRSYFDPPTKFSESSVQDISLPDTAIPIFLWCRLCYLVVALFIVQTFYAFYSWRASKNMVISMLITLMSFGALVLGLVVAANLVRDSAFSSLAQGSTKITMITSQIFFFLSGLLTLGTLSYYLNPSYNPSAPVIKDLDDQAIAYLVSRGALATSFQLSFVLVFVVHSSTTLWMPFQFLTSKVFTNSLLTMLNSRPARNGMVYDPREERRIGVTPFSAHHTSNVCFNVVDSRIDEHGQETSMSRTDTNTIRKSVLDDSEDLKGCWQDNPTCTTTSSSNA